MKKVISRNIQKGKTRHELLQDKTIKRFWGNATRLEQGKSRSKNSNKPR